MFRFSTEVWLWTDLTGSWVQAKLNPEPMQPTMYKYTVYTVYTSVSAQELNIISIICLGSFVDLRHSSSLWTSLTVWCRTTILEPSPRLVMRDSLKSHVYPAWATRFRGSFRNVCALAVLIFSLYLFNLAHAQHANRCKSGTDIYPLSFSFWGKPTGCSSYPQDTITTSCMILEIIQSFEKKKIICKARTAPWVWQRFTTEA